MQAEPTVLQARALGLGYATSPEAALRAQRSFPLRLVEFAQRKPLGAVGAVIVLLLVLVALAAPWLAPYPYDVGVASERLQGPTVAHPFGTDANGRDMLSRIIWGARISVTVGFGAVLLSTFLAITIGNYYCSQRVLPMELGVGRALKALVVAAGLYNFS